MFRLFLTALLFLVQSCSDSEKERKGRLEELHLKSEALHHQIEAEEKKALDANVKSEGYMRGDYAQFAESLEKAEESENKVQVLKEELEHLQQEKKKFEH